MSRRSGSVLRAMRLLVGLGYALLLLPVIGASRVAAASIAPAQFQTENGITVLSLAQSALPIVTIEVLIRAGGIDDPRPKIGLANMAAELLEAGTKNRSAEDISEALDFIGAELSIAVSEDYTTIEMRVLKKDIAVGFELLSDLLIRPIFKPEEIARIRKRIAGEILAQQDQPGRIARLAFEDTIYGQHPYHYPLLGFEETIEKINRRDLVVFHKRYYRPNNMILAVVGDVTEAETKALVDSHFGGWEKGMPTFSPAHPALPLPAPALRRIEKDLSQATVVLGHVGIARANPDYDAIKVMNYILGGGGFSSRLMQDLRDNKGLVYSIYSYFSTNREPGAFSVIFKTKNGSVGEAASAVLQAIEKLRETGVQEEELNEAKAYLTGSFPLQIDTTRKIASLLTRIAFYDLGLDYIDTYAERINRVTREDVFRVALKYIHPRHMAFVVVGKQALMTLGPIEKDVAD